MLRRPLPSAEESVSKLNFFTPKAFSNLAQGNTLGGGGAPEPTLKALNIDPRAKPTTERIIKPLQGTRSLGGSDPRVLPWAKLENAFGVWRLFIFACHRVLTQR
jgi:hypothetical protein